MSFHRSLGNDRLRLSEMHCTDDKKHTVARKENCWPQQGQGESHAKKHRINYYQTLSMHRQT